MTKQLVKIGLDTYEKKDNILEHIDEKGFKTEIILDSTEYDKTREQIENDLIKILLKKY